MITWDIWLLKLKKYWEEWLIVFRMELNELSCSSNSDHNVVGVKGMVGMGILSVTKGQNKIDN